MPFDNSPLQVVGAYLVAIPTLDSVFTNDFPGQMYATSMITIN